MPFYRYDPIAQHFRETWNVSKRPSYLPNSPKYQWNVAAYTITSVNRDIRCSIRRAVTPFRERTRGVLTWCLEFLAELLRRNIYFRSKGVFPARNRVIARTYRNTGRHVTTTRGVILHLYYIDVHHSARWDSFAPRRIKVVRGPRHVTMYNMRTVWCYLDVVSTRPSQLSTARIRYLEHR